MLDGEVMPAFFINKITELIYLNIILGFIWTVAVMGFPILLLYSCWSW